MRCVYRGRKFSVWYWPDMSLLPCLPLYLRYFCFLRLQVCW